MSGVFELERARVRWFLSVDQSDLPVAVRAQGKTAYRSLSTDGHEIEFSDGFPDLHTAVYRDILDGGGFGIEDARPAIQLAYDIRSATPVAPSSIAHPLCYGQQR
jgi:UDP-N-acetyl-2-amino-2-deoxyglucuronate dehydrogenase